MRFFLTPLSRLTWANLNHTLCGIDNDPWREYFELKEYYYFWAEFYLLLGAITTTSMVAFLGRCLFFHTYQDNQDVTDKVNILIRCLWF
jgi:hypothetical protein